MFHHIQLDKTANLMEIKSSYRKLQKQCHPDILGDDQGHEMSILLNDVRTDASCLTMCLTMCLRMCAPLARPVWQWLPHVGLLCAALSATVPPPTRSVAASRAAVPCCLTCGCAVRVPPPTLSASEAAWNSGVSMASARDRCSLYTQY
jgi:hypothetical protein